MKLDGKRLLNIAKAMVFKTPAPRVLMNQVPFVMTSDLIPVPKARPRMGKTGRVYTPKTTADFEKALAKLATEKLASKGWKPPLFSRYVTVELVLYDKPYKAPPNFVSDAMEANVQLPLSIGDLDNKAKAILDALNGIVYADDSLIDTLVIGTDVSETGGFTIVVRESPRLTRDDVKSLAGYYKAMQP